MATTTPNFGWPVPTSTDLVKDGATAIEALGDGVDASLVDLKGGTTGQVLAKATNTDLDFAWVTQDDANAIQNAQLTAKGALITAFSAGSPATLTVGNNGETLVADSSTSTGLRYQQSFGVNTLINGNADIWQRGTTSAAIAYGTYLADRWKCLNNGTGQNSTYSQSTSVPNAGSLYSLKLQQLSTSATSVTEYNFAQPIETTMVEPLAGKNVVLSFWYRSNKTGNHNARIYATSQTGGTDVTNTFTVSVADTWEYKTITFTSFAAITAIATGATAEGAGVQVGYRTYAGSGSVTVAANDYFQITQIKLEVGSVATAFSRAGGNIQGELAACQRYYFRVSGLSGGFAELGQAAARSTTVADQSYPLPVTMRVAPTSVDWAVNQYLSTYYGNTQYTVTSVTLDTPTTPTRACTQLAVASGLTAGTRYMNYLQNTTSAFIGFSAEL